MFRGNHPTRVDEKGRLKLPAEFKRLVDERYGTHFYITSKDGRAAEIYPLSEWQKIEEKVAQIPSMNPAKRSSWTGSTTTGRWQKWMRKDGSCFPRSCGKRRSWPEMLWFLEQQTYLEVANHDEFKQAMETDPLTADDQQAFSEFWDLNRPPRGSTWYRAASGMCRFFYKMRSDI